MFVCRCCLTFEDNLYPFAEYEPAFKDCTGLAVEQTALICPLCIRKLNDAFAFRELSLKSNEILLNKQAVTEIDIKTEPADDETDEVCNEEYLDFDELKHDEELQEEEIREPKVKRRKTVKKEEKAKSLAHSIRAKTAWTQEAKENLIKECPFCFLCGIPKADLMRHVQEHIVLNGGYQCDHCDKKFMKKRQLKRHIHRMFLGLKDGAPINDGLTLTSSCIECHESFPRKSLLRIHYKEQHPELLEQRGPPSGIFTCMQCGKQLRTKKSLECHELTHTGLRKTYICPVCGRGYKTKEGLRYHELVHTDKRPFICSVEGCNRGFKTKENLRDHEPIHTGDLNFSCHICGKRFRARNLLVGHRVLHETEPKHTCSVCGLKFKRANNLRDHQLSHTERRDFCCGICGTAFKSRSSLKRHMKQHAIKMGLDENSIELRLSNGEGYRLEGYIVQAIPVTLQLNIQ